MLVRLHESEWIKQSCTIIDDRIIVEEGTEDRPHGVYRNLDLNGATQAVLQVVVRPIERTRCWVGARANNRSFMASFDLEAGQTLSASTNVTHHEIIDRNDGSFECRIRLDGTFPTESPVLAVGALIEDQHEDYTGIEGLQAIELTHFAYASGIDYVEFADEETSSEENVFHFVQASPDTVTATGIPYFTGSFTASCVVEREEEKESSLMYHWDEQERSWRLFLTDTGNPAVELSKDGEQVGKRYESTRPLVINTEYLLSFTWDGADLKLFINDTELTERDETISRVIDDPIEGALPQPESHVIAEPPPGHSGCQYWLWNQARTPVQIEAFSRTLSLTGLPPLPGDPESDFPRTRQEMERWLQERGVLANNIRYVDNLSGSDQNDGRTIDRPWRTIQQAANQLTAGMAVIIRGRGGRFFEQVTPTRSGNATDKIWYVGDPEFPAILDSSEIFDVAWTPMGNGRWRAPYNRNRKFSPERIYVDNCTGGSCRHESVFISHQLIYRDAQLIRVSQASVPQTFAEGTCFFQRGGGSYDTPQFVWCRLPGDVNPNHVDMRIGSDKKYLFDWSPHTWETFPGGDGQLKAHGRDHLALVNIHFRFGSYIRKLAPLNVRGKGWHVEHCSFSESNTYGISLAGDNHFVKDCKVFNAGQGVFRADHLQNNEGKTRFERCLFEGGNLHRYPEGWEAGQKFTHCGKKGTTEFVECLFKDIHGPGLWWDIFNGDKNRTVSPSFLVQRCIFENCARNAVFLEHNSYNITIEHCGIWNTAVSNEGKFRQVLATAIRSQGTGKNTIRNNAIVFNKGKGLYFKAHDLRGDNNRDIIENNVFVNNARDTSVSLERCEFYGGDEPNHQGTNYEWSSSGISGNVFYTTTASTYFIRDNNNSRTSTNDLIRFQSPDWTGGTNNVIATTASTVVENYQNRKMFWLTRGVYSDKGPQQLRHYEDLGGTRWIIPRNE